MSDVIDLHRRKTNPGGTFVAAPRPCDRLSSTLHRAYDNSRGMPDDFLRLLARLDGI